MIDLSVGELGADGSVSLDFACAAEGGMCDLSPPPCTFDCDASADGGCACTTEQQRCIDTEGRTCICVEVLTLDWFCGPIPPG